MASVGRPDGTAARVAGRGEVADGTRPAAPSRAASPAYGQVVVDRARLEAALHGQPGEQGLDQHGQLLGLGHRLGADGRGPSGQPAGRVPPGLGVAAADHLGHLGVAGRPSHSSCSRRDHRPGRLGGGAGHVVPHRGQLAERGLGHRHLGQQHGQHRVLPRVEQRQQQALLAAEVGVDRSRGPAGGLGHRVHRHRVDALLGEELGGGGQQAVPRLGLPFLLGLRHVPPTVAAPDRPSVRVTVLISEALCNRSGGPGRPAGGRPAAAAPGT